MATIIDGKQRIPFMRGMLMHYLIQRDFTHEEASEIANSVRDDLSKEKNIPKKDLLRLIDKRIRRNYADRNLGDLVFWDRAPTIISVERKSGTLPFSKETLSHSVQASGLSTDGSYQIAQTIESQLIDQRRTRITHEELEDLTAAMLARHHSEAYAERYQVWRTLSDMDKPLIILIGGASGVGKTSLAINLASVLDIPRVVATDDIRQIMRLMLAPDLMPSIHDSSYAAQAPDIPGIDPNIAGFREQAKAVGVGVHAIMSRSIEENASVIIDGVHLLPDFINVNTYSASVFLVPLCLSLSDRSAYEERFSQREAEAPGRPMHRYLSHIEEILQIQEHILERSAEYDIPVIEASTAEEVTSAAVMVVAERLQEQSEIQKALSSGTGKKKKKKKA